MPESPSAVPPDDRYDGSIVVRHPNPIAAARAIAAEAGAPMVRGGPAVRAVTDERAARGGPPPAALDRERLDRLYEAMRRAEVVLDRTRDRVVDGLARSLNTSLAIHPETVRRAAAAALRTEEALRRARAGDPPGPARARQAWSTLGVIAVVAGVAVAVTDSLATGLLLIAVAAGATLVATSSVRRHHRSLVPVRLAERDLARHRWQQLAGRGVEPEDLDRVLLRYDPHRETVADLASNHPAVRAATRAVSDRRRAWVRAWEAAVATPVSDEEPPTVDPSTGEAGDLPGSSPVLVLVAPDEGLPVEEARRLRGDLERLHDPGVVLVVGTGQPAPDDAITIDLRHPPPAPSDPEADPAVRLA